MKLEDLPPAERFAQTGVPTMRASAHDKSIEIVKVFFLRGPNLWTYRPVLEAWVDIGGLEDHPSNTIPGLYERLTAWLPTLVEHRCGIGERGGFLQRLRDGTWCAHILEHVTIELQNLAGIPTGFGKARETSRRGVYKVAVRTPGEEIGRAALASARELVMAAIEDRACDVAAMVGRLRAMAAEYGLDPDTACIVDAAAERRIPSLRLGQGGLVQLGYGARQHRIRSGETTQTGAIAQGIAGDKALARSLLRSCGVPVVEGRAVESAQDAWEAARDIGVPVVVKPRDGKPGHGISANLCTREDIEAAYRATLGAALEEDSEVLVERFVPGNRYRLLVVGGRMVAAEDDARDVTALVHPDTAAAASLAVRIVGLDVAGVDLVAQDVARPLAEQQGAIVGIDVRPRLRMRGAPQPAGQAIVEHLFAEGDNGRIPIVGISGSRGKTMVARLVAQLLQAHGARVGLACSDGLYLGRRPIGQGDCATLESAQRILRNPGVDAAVIENSGRAILSEGLGYDRCAVGIVTNIDCTDVLSEYDVNDAQQMANVIRTQVDVVLPDGAAILNAADPRVAELARLCDGEVIFFAPAPDLPVIAAHRSRQGRALFAEGGRIVFATGARTSAMPLAVPARPSELEIMLAAAGAAWALGLPMDLIRAGLEDFQAESGPAAIEAAALVQAWVQGASAQSRKAVHGNIADQGIARPQSLEPAYGHRSHCDLLRT